MTSIDLVTSKEYAYHHTSTRRGYVSRKGDGKIIQYSGRFGSGYIWIIPRKDSSTYVYYAYYIRKD